MEVFGLVQELLPAVSALNQKYAPPAFNPNQSTDSTTGNQPEQGLSACTTSSHYAVLESDHPYKQAGVTQYKVNKQTNNYFNAQSQHKIVKIHTVKVGAMGTVAGTFNFPLEGSIKDLI